MSKLKDYKAVNEPVLSYLKNSVERKNIIEEYKYMFNSKTDIPLYIGSEKIFTEQRKDILPPHDHKKIVGTYSQADENHVKSAIDNLLKNKKKWSETNWEERCNIFLKAADLISKKI